MAKFTLRMTALLLSFCLLSNPAVGGLRGPTRSDARGDAFLLLSENAMPGPSLWALHALLSPKWAAALRAPWLREQYRDDPEGLRQAMIWREPGWETPVIYLISLSMGVVAGAFLFSLAHIALEWIHWFRYPEARRISLGRLVLQTGIAMPVRFGVSVVLLMPFAGVRGAASADVFSTAGWTIVAAGFSYLLHAAWNSLAPEWLSMALLRQAPAEEPLERFSNGSGPVRHYIFPKRAPTSSHPTEAVTEKSPNGNGVIIKAGVTLEHPDYGLGTVQSILNGRDYFTASVKFGNGYGIKNIAFVPGHHIKIIPGVSPSRLTGERKPSRKVSAAQKAPRHKATSESMVPTVKPLATVEGKEWITRRLPLVFPVPQSENRTQDVAWRIETYAKEHGLMGRLTHPDSPVRAVWYRWAEGEPCGIEEDFEQTLEKFSAVLDKAPILFFRTGWKPEVWRKQLLQTLPTLQRHERMRAFRQLFGKSLRTVGEEMLRFLQAHNPDFVSPRLKDFIQNLREIENGTHSGFNSPARWAAYCHAVGVEDPFLIQAGWPKAEAVHQPVHPKDWFEILQNVYGKTVMELRVLLKVGHVEIHRRGQSGLPGLTFRDAVIRLDGEIHPFPPRGVVSAA